MNLTQEQKDILEAFLKGENIKINAFAGSGKTTTLKLLVDNVPDKKFLVLAFNAAIKQELERKFPHNASVFTTHSFCLRQVRPYLRRKNISNNDKVLITEISDYYKLDYKKSFFLYKLFLYYLNSDQKEISLKFLIKLLNANDKLKIMFKNFGFTFLNLAAYIRGIYNNIEEGKFSLIHSFYIKYFQLNIDKFKPKLNYDVIMLDEAQDTNDVTKSIFESLNGQKVIVGDTHQSIYGWRGAVNILPKFDYKTFYLSYSFRVNTDIAQKADFILKNYKNEIKTLKAYFSNGGEGNSKTCIITRTNSAIIKYIDNLPDGESIKLERRIDEIFNTALQINKVKMYYFTGNRTYLAKVPAFIKAIVDENKTWEDFKNYVCDNIEDMEYCSACGLVERVEILKVYHKAKYLKYDSDCKTYIATAHSIKGKEYENVIIMNDFRDIFNDMKKDLIEEKKLTPSKVYDLFYNHPTHPLVRKYVEEVNLIYVAITRAIKHLDIKSDAVNNLLSTPKDNFTLKLL